MSEYVPASVLVSSKYQVLYHFGETADFLRYPTGETTDDLFSLLREGLVTRVRGAVHKVLREKSSVKVQGARVKRDGRFIPVAFRVKSLNTFEGGDGLLLVSFEEEYRHPPGSPHTQDQNMDDEPIVKQLEYELNTTKEELQNTIEELETSKEELQSLNEELNTVNNELQEKLSNLETANNDLTNLMHSTKNASIFLDSRLNIKFFTPSSKQLFNLIATDIGRPISDIVPKFDNPGLTRDIENVLETLRPSNNEVRDHQGRWFNRRIMPYRTSDNRILGTVITFDDITDVKNALESSRIEEEFKSLILDNIHEQVVFFDLDGKAQWSNRAAQKALHKQSEEIKGLSCCEIWQPSSPENCKKCPVTQCLKGKKDKSGEVDCDDRYWIQAAPLTNNQGKRVGIVELRRPLRGQAVD